MGGYTNTRGDVRSINFPPNNEANKNGAKEMADDNFVPIPSSRGRGLDGLPEGERKRLETLVEKVGEAYTQSNGYVIVEHYKTCRLMKLIAEEIFPELHLSFRTAKGIKRPKDETRPWRQVAFLEVGCSAPGSGRRNGNIKKDKPAPKQTDDVELDKVLLTLKKLLKR